MLKSHVAELRAIRDQARADAERAQEAIERTGPSITSQALKTFARQARKRVRTEGGGYRRDHLRALAQRVDLDAHEVRIMGSKSVLLRTLVAASGAKTAGFGVPSFGAEVARQFLTHSTQSRANTQRLSGGRCYAETEINREAEVA